jgi:ribosomal protein L34E
MVSECKAECEGIMQRKRAGGLMRKPQGYEKQNKPIGADYCSSLNQQPIMQAAPDRSRKI